jgi:hypothetical protein
MAGRLSETCKVWLIEALQALKNDEWKSDSPVYFDGTGFESSARDAAAVRFLEAFCTPVEVYLLF